MINTEKPFNIHDYVEILLRRLWYILIPFVVMSLAAVIYTFTATKLYRADTLILVTPQKVPVDYVRPTVTSRIEDRLQSIGQEIMSRTRLEQVISELKLYAEEAKSHTREEIVEVMRKNIRVEIKGSQGFFTISYIGKDPRIVTFVTNKLASLFIEENLKLREQQAQGTTEFLGVELTATKAKLEEQERLIAQFKRQYMYELPEQRDVNLRVLDQLQLQSQRINDGLRSAQDRKVIVQRQIAEMRNMAAFAPREENIQEKTSHDLSAPSLSPVSGPQPSSYLQRLKDLLAELQGKYTQKHPDVVATKKKIADLEEKLKASPPDPENVQAQQVEEKILSAPAEPEPDLFSKELESSLVATEAEIQRLREEDSKVKVKISEYGARLENTPVRELAMTNLTRDYQNTRDRYQSLLTKSQEAQQAENLERRQKGEQFKVIDPARLPEKPFQPNIPRNLIMGFLVAVCSGIGCAFLKEQTDRSFMDPEDLEATVGLRVLANIPAVDQKRAA